MENSGLRNNLKKELVEQCDAILSVKIARLKKNLDDLQEDLNNESKSSAGDKYETGREMINLEWNKLSAQMNELLKLREILLRIDPERKNDLVTTGSIIMTNKNNYFLSVPLGELKMENDVFFAVGVNAPIVKPMLGKAAGEKVIFNDQHFEIEHII